MQKIIKISLIRKLFLLKPLKSEEPSEEDIDVPKLPSKEKKQMKTFERKTQGFPYSETNFNYNEAAREENNNVGEQGMRMPVEHSHRRMFCDFPTSEESIQLYKAHKMTFLFPIQTRHFAMSVVRRNSL